MQLTDNDLTTPLSSTDADDFYIPSDDYDEVTADPGGKPSHGVTDGDSTSTKPAEPILSQDLLHAINEQVSKAIAAAVQAATSK